MSDDHEEYDENLFEDFGEGFEDEFDAVSEKVYEDSFKDPKEIMQENENASNEFLEEEEIDESEYEFYVVVGGRDKKPIMSALNKGKLSKYEMDDLLNQL